MAILKYKNPNYTEEGNEEKWIEITTGITDASSDGNLYGRKNGNWESIEVPTNISELINDANYVTSSELDSKGYQTEEDCAEAVATAVADLVNSAPETLDTLQELAAALGNDPNFATTITTLIGSKVDTDTYNSDKETFALKAELPTKTSDLTNDSGYITSDSLSGYAKTEDIPSLDDYAKTSDIPTKTSDLTNDSGYITVDEVPTYTLPAASTTELGGVKLGVSTQQTAGFVSTTSVSGRTYVIQFDGNNCMVVNVPWTDTTYEEATTSTAGLMSAADKTKLDELDTSNSSYTLPVATNEELGGVRLVTDVKNTTAYNEPTTTSGRTYCVLLNDANQMVVNVPWTDTVTESSGGSSGSTVSWEGRLSSGYEIGTLTIDNTTYNIFVPETTSYTLPTATVGALGGVRLYSSTVLSTTPNSVTSTSGRTYAVQLNSSNQMVVNVPWTDTVTEAYELPVASYTALGGVRLYTASPQTTDVNTVSNTTGRTYAVQLNANNQMVVNVPWTDSGASMGNVIVISRSITGFGNYDLSGESGLDYTIGEYIIDTDESPYVLYQIVSSSNSSGRDKQVVAWDTSTLYVQGSSLYVWNGSALVSVSSSAAADLTNYVSKSSSSLQTITGPLAAQYFLETSDERLKYDIKPVGNRTDVLDIEYKEFKWSATDHTGFGVIAQEVEPIVPEAVSETSEGFKTVNYNMLHSLQINALMNKIKELETKIEELRNG